MNCPRCGANNPDHSNFCTACGLDLRPHKQPSQPPQGGEDTLIFHQREELPYYEAPKKKKKREKQKKKQHQESGRWKLIRLIVLSLVLALALGGAICVAVYLKSGPAGEGAACLYLSEGSYELVNNLKGENPTELGGGVYASSNDKLVTFTEDGKYVYYFTQVDSYSETGTLCRAEYAQLKGHSSKNDQYMQVIATNVCLNQCQILNDGRAIYLNSEGILYEYGDTGVAQVARNVTAFYVDEDNEGGRLAYESQDNSGNALYCAALYEPGAAQLLARNYSYISVYDGLGEILVMNQDEEWNNYLAVVSIDHAPLDLGQAYLSLMTGDGFYYVANEGAAVSPYDYVVDSLASQEAGMAEPDLEDYAIEEYAYQQLSHNSDLSKYSEIYTSCTKTLAFWHTSMASAASSYASDPAIQSFVDTYGPQANEDGYIVVTNEIAEALQAMAETYGQHYDGEWLEFCFAYDVADHTYDYDAFNQAVEAYHSAVDRIELREKLQSGEYDIPLYSLYLFQDGASTLICDQVLGETSLGNVLLYNTPEGVTPVKLEELASPGDVYDGFYLDLSKENFCVGGGQTAPVKLSAQAADCFYAAWNAGYAELFLLGSDLFLSESSGALAVAPVSEGAVGAFSILSDNAALLDVDTAQGCVYYGANLYHNGEGDLYRWQEGTSTCLATEVAFSDLTIYEDGSILAYTDSDSFSYYYGSSLKLIRASGAQETIGQGVTDFIRLEGGKLLYLSDGGLYVFNGKESTILASQAERVWSSTSMPVSKVLNFNR